VTGGWAEAFDALAAGYDDWTGGGWAANNVAVELLAPLGLRPSRVLDLGAGTGQTTEALARLFPEAAFTLVDPSQGMLDIARGKLPAETIVRSDATDSLRSTPHASWDLVAAIGCLELVPDMFEVLRLSASRLVPGGHLVASHEPVHGTSVQGQARSELSGGRVVQRHTIEEVERRAAAYGLVRVADRVFEAFQRGDAGEGAVYELVVWSVG
jgi:ubiquinone/menaquinone biosynthesis C-methylase UbiE